jgi:prophage regulatory protein
MDGITQTQTTRILRRREVQALVGLARSTIYQAVAAGTFPAPIHLTQRSVGWVAAEVEAWIAARVAESRAAEAGRP